MTESKHPSLYRIVIIFVMARVLERFTTNVYVAVLPIITIMLAVSHRVVQLSMVVYLIFGGIAQLLSGLGDRYRKHWLLMTCPILVIVGSLIIIIFHDIWALIIGRAVQALGAASAPIIGNAYLSDMSLRYEDVDNRVTIKLFSLFGAIVTAFPALAMYLGSVMTKHYGWQSSFTLLLAVSIITLVIFYWMDRGIKIESQKETSVLQNYVILIKNKAYMARSLSFALLVTGITAYYLLSVFIYHRVFHIAVHIIGLLAFFQVFAYLFGRLLGPSIYTKWGEKHLLWSAMTLTLFSALLMLFLNYFFSPHLGFILWPIVGYSFAIGAMSPCVNVGIMRLVPNTASSAEGLFNLMISIVNVIIGLIVTQLSIYSGIDLSILLVIVSFIALGLLYFLD